MLIWLWYDNCYECFVLGGKVGGGVFLWLVNFIFLVMGLCFLGILGGIGGGIWWGFLFGFFGGIGGVLLLFWVMFWYLFIVIDLVGFWGIFGIIFDICWCIGEVICLEGLLLFINVVWCFVWFEGFFGGILGGGFCFGKFLMLI